MSSLTRSHGGAPTNDNRGIAALGAQLAVCELYLRGICGDTFSKDCSTMGLHPGSRHGLCGYRLQSAHRPPSLTPMSILRWGMVEPEGKGQEFNLISGVEGKQGVQVIVIVLGHLGSYV